MYYNKYKMSLSIDKWAPSAYKRRAKHIIDNKKIYLLQPILNKGKIQFPIRKILIKQFLSDQNNINIIKHELDKYNARGIIIRKLKNTLGYYNKLNALCFIHDIDKHVQKIDDAYLPPIPNHSILKDLKIAESFAKKFNQIRSKQSKTNCNAPNSNISLEANLKLDKEIYIFKTIYISWYKFISNENLHLVKTLDRTVAAARENLKNYTTILATQYNIIYCNNTFSNQKSLSQKHSYIFLYGAELENLKNEFDKLHSKHKYLLEQQDNVTKNKKPKGKLILRTNDIKVEHGTLKKAIVSLCRGFFTKIENEEYDKEQLTIKSSELMQKLKQFKSAMRKKVHPDIPENGLNSPERILASNVKKELFCSTETFFKKINKDINKLTESNDQKFIAKFFLNRDTKYQIHFTDSYTDSEESILKI